MSAAHSLSAFLSSVEFMVDTETFTSVTNSQFLPEILHLVISSSESIFYCLRNRDKVLQDTGTNTIQ